MFAARWTLIYRGVDISGDLAPMTTSIAYTDKLHGEADEIEVACEDAKGLWRGPWCPVTGDLMQLWYGRSVGAMMYAGEFELDEPEVTIGRGGDSMTIRGIAAPITAALRTEKTFVYENKTLQEIVGEVAGRNGLTVQGTINPTRWRRKTQRRQRDLEFLVELGEDTDHYVSVRGKTVIFTSVDAIDGLPPAGIFFPASPDHAGFTGRFQTVDTYTKAEARHFHDEDKRLIKGEEVDARVLTGDSLILVERAEDEAQAKMMAKGRLHQKNRKRRSGTLTLVGRPELVAGTVVELVDHGKWSGRYVVDASRHILTRGPYVTNLDLVEARA